jgi:hypothetical protein
VYRAPASLKGPHPNVHGVALQRNQRFQDALKWLEYIFNPTDNRGGRSQQRFWQIAVQRDELGGLAQAADSEHSLNATFVSRTLYALRKAVAVRWTS